MQTASLAIRFGLAIAFLVAGLSKLRFTEQFAGVIRNYSLVQDRWSKPIARWLPRLELTLGLLLLLGVLEREMGVVAALMLTMFAGAAVVNLLRGRQVECGCFGVAGRRHVTWWMVGEDVVLALGALVLAAHPSATLAVARDPSLVPRPSLVDGIAILMSTSLVLVGIFLTAGGWRLLHASRRFSETMRSRE